MSENLICSICKKGSLFEYKGKPNERCDHCGAKARHRVAAYLYQNLLTSFSKHSAKCLHLAPEKPFLNLLEGIFKGGYTPVDANPSRYAHVNAIEFRLPDAFSFFPKNYFDVIIHNHVLEHIPGTYKDHLIGLVNLLRPNGLMVFSVPGPYKGIMTMEGGENFKTDEERLKTFGLEDHLKSFGDDFVEYLNLIPGTKLLADGITNEIRESLYVRPNKAPFFIIQKDTF